MTDTPRRRATLRRQRETFLAKLFAYSLIAAVVGGGLAAFNTTNFYMKNKNNLTAYIPETMLADSTGNALVMLTDGRGQPLAGEQVKIEVKKGGQSVWQEDVNTDANGLASPSFAGLTSTGTAEVTVRGAGETLTRTVNIETTTRIYLQTDKPIYQPGQTVHIRTLAFSGFSPSVSTENVVLDVSAPSNDRIFRKTLAPDEYGIAAYDYPLGDRLPFGLYKVKATISKESVEKSFGVQRYVLPRFVISFENMRGWYSFRESTTGRLCADYVFGKEVAGSATIVASAYTGSWSDLATVTSPLTGGCMDFNVPGVSSSDENAGGYIELKATVTDTAGHSEMKTKDIPLSNLPILITLMADSNVRGAVSNYYVIARWPDNTPVAGASMSSSVTSGTTTTDSRGIARISFTYNGESSISVRITQGQYAATLAGRLDSDNGVKVVADRGHYNVGDPAQISFHFSGESPTDWVYYEIVARNFVIQAGRLTLSGGQAAVNVNVDTSLVPLAEVRAYKILPDLTVSRDSCVFTVGTLSNLDVNITADKQEYRPAEDVKLNFSVRQGGAPVSAALGVAIVDTAVYEVDERFRGLEDALNGEGGTVPYEQQIIEYVYGGRSTPPALGAPEVVTPESTLSMSMQSSLPATEKTAKDQQSKVVSGFLFTLVLIGLAGYVGLVFFGLRNRKFAAAALALTIAIPAMTALVYFVSRGEWGYSGDLMYPYSGGLLGGGTASAPTTNSGNEPLESGGGTGFLPTEAGWGWPGSDNSGGNEPFRYSGQNIIPPSRIRTFFPETWYWNPSLIVGPDGLGSVTIPAPDSITTWAVDAVASTKDAEFGTGNTQVRVFQDFFVEPDIPVAAIQNDTFDLQVSVFNYLSYSQNVNVQLQPDAWFDITGPSLRQITLGANTVASTNFTITARQLGVHNVTILAGNARISDAVVRPMRVDPRGTPFDQTFSGRLTSTETKSLTLSLRGDRIPGSESAFVRIQPSILSVVLDGAENYIRYVSGCGEQSLSMLNIDVVAFNIISANASADKLKGYEDIVNEGIQHELQFLVPVTDGVGRGITWFSGSDAVDPWLTSWGLVTFQDAINAGFGIDENVVKDMQKYLVSIQQQDGSWLLPSWGSKANPILRAKQVAGTAYIARALLRSGYPTDDPAVARAIGYVESNVRDNWDSPFTLALSLIVLVDGGKPSSLRSDIAARLVELRYEENGTVYWKSQSTFLSDGEYARPGYYSEYDSRTSETTGYAMMALNKQVGTIREVAGGVQYLLSKRNTYGGWMSTQDTIVALEALIEVGSGVAASNLDATVTANGTQAGAVHFDETTKDLTYLLDITANLTPVTVVEISTSGTGSVVYQLVLRQYIPWNNFTQPPCELCLTMTYSGTQVTVGQNITATIGLVYGGELDQLKMVLVTVKSGVGLRFDQDSLDSLVNEGVISLYESSPGSVLLYVENVAKGAHINFAITLTGVTQFRGTVEGPSAFDMYDPGLTVRLPPAAMTVTW